jgi:hypothetical protein
VVRPGLSWPIGGFLFEGSYELMDMTKPWWCRYIQHSNTHVLYDLYGNLMVFNSCFFLEMAFNGIFWKHTFWMDLNGT